LILRSSRSSDAAACTYAHTYARAHLSTYLGLLFFASKFTREKRLRGLSRLILSTVKFKFKPTYRNMCIRHIRIRARARARLSGPFRSLFSRRRSAKVGGLSVGYRKYFPTPRIYRASARKYLKIPSTTREMKGRKGRREKREQEAKRRRSRREATKFFTP